MKYGMELLIHPQISMVQPLKFGATVEVWEWVSYFIPHSLMNVIDHPF